MEGFQQRMNAPQGMLLADRMEAAQVMTKGGDGRSAKENGDKNGKVMDAPG